MISTPPMPSAIFELVREINSAVSPNAHPTKALAEGCRALYLELSDVLGIPFSEKNDALTPEQEALFNARKDAAKQKTGRSLTASATSSKRRAFS